MSRPEDGIGRGDRVVITLTPDQQEEIRLRAGVRQSEIVLSTVQLAALTLSATAVGSDVLPIGRTNETVRRLLQSDQVNADPAIIALSLTAEQREQVRRITGKTMSAVRLSCDDYEARFNEEWHSQAGPRRISGSIAVAPAGQTGEWGDSVHIVLLPNRGIAASAEVFGTGMHATTQLALSLLEAYLRPLDRVLDLGTGSGILAVAAARLGAREVHALDIEPAAVSAARETVALNGVERIVRVGEGSIEAADPPYDLVVANIYANVIVALAPDLVAALNPGGRLVVSAITTALSQRVVDTFSAAALCFRDHRKQEHWSALAFERPFPQSAE